MEERIIELSVDNRSEVIKLPINPKTVKSDDNPAGNGRSQSSRRLWIKTHKVFQLLPIRKLSFQQQS